MNKTIKNNWRFISVSALLVVLMLALLLRMLMIQVLDADYGVGFLKKQGDQRTIRNEVVEAHRGMITDRRGEPLAISTPVVSIWIDPKLFDSESEQLETFAFLLEKTPDDIIKKVKRYKDKRFVYMKKDISPYDADAIAQLNIEGVYRKSEFRRYYPTGEVTANLLGYTQRNGTGLEGIEYAYNHWLQGENGHRRVVQDLYQRTIKVLGQPVDPKPGRNLALSIDSRLQFLAYKELKAAVKHHGAHAGSIVIIDNDSGEVLAMASQPSFNPNDREKIDMSHVKNRALTDVFEPGSTMKPLSMLAALDSGKFSPNDTIDTNPGYLKLGRKTLLDPVNYGNLTLTRIITKSSQVGMSKLALKMEPMEIPRMLDKLGLGQYIGTGMPGENGGYVPHDPSWSAIERASLAYGYGVTVNSLQLAKAYSVVAAEGKAYPISLLKLDHEPLAQQIVKTEVASEVLDMLKTVVGKGGTGRKARTEAYSVAGKTGTSHKVGETGYELNYISLFAGMAPADDPKITVVVVIDDPKGKQYFGGEVAAPIFSKVVSASLRILDVQPDLLVKNKHSVNSAQRAM